MSININFGESSYNSFRSMSFYSQSCLVPPPRATPGAKSYIRMRGSNIAKMIEGNVRNPKMYTFFFPSI